MTQHPVLAAGEAIYAIVHSTDFARTAIGEAAGLNDYEAVALLRARDLEDAYRASNHIDTRWTDNPEVLWVQRRSAAFPAGPRSTSVGDLVVAITLADGPDGQHVAATAHLVASFGFRQLDSLLAEVWCRRVVSIAGAAGLLPPGIQPPTA